MTAFISAAEMPFCASRNSLVGNRLHVVDDGVRARRQVQAPGAAVGRIGAAFDVAGFFQPVDDAADGDRFHLELLGQFGLAHAFAVGNALERAPLGAGQLETHGAAVEMLAHHAGDVVDQKAERRLVGGFYCLVHR